MRLGFSILALALAACATSPNPFEEASDGSINRDQFAWVFDQNAANGNEVILNSDRECTIDTAWQSYLDNRAALAERGEKVADTGLANRERAVAILISKAAVECERAS